MSIDRDPTVWVHCHVVVYWDNGGVDAEGGDCKSHSYATKSNNMSGTVIKNIHSNPDCEDEVEDNGSLFVLASRVLTLALDRREDGCEKDDG